MQCALLAIVVGVAVCVPVDPTRLVPGGLLGLLLTLLAVMAGAGAAVLAAVSAMLAQSAPMGRLALGLAGYSLVMLPLSSPLPNAVTHPAFEAALLVVWAVPAGGYLGIGLRRRCRGLGWVGSGTAVVGFAHVENGLGVASGADFDLVFGGLRLLGLLLAAAGVVILAHRSQRTLQQQRGELASRLALAEEVRVQLADRAAHRDHEIRNGLSGLSGISELVRSHAPTHDRERLRVAVEGQLTRLGALLDGAEDSDGCYRIGSLVTEIVATRPPDGASIDICVPEELRVRGRRAVAGHVLGELLAERVAGGPGSLVRIDAAESGERVVLRIVGGRQDEQNVAPDLARQFLAADGATLGTEDGTAGGDRVLILSFAGPA